MFYIFSNDASIIMLSSGLTPI